MNEEAAGRESQHQQQRAQKQAAVTAAASADEDGRAGTQLHSDYDLNTKGIISIDDINIDIPSSSSTADPTRQVGSEEDHQDESLRGTLIMNIQKHINASTSISEIEEIAATSARGEMIIRGGGAGRMSPVLEIGTTDTSSSLFSLDFVNGARNNNYYNNEGGRDDEVYVAVLDKGPTSMDALVWALNHAVINPATALVYLIHVFPELKFVPSPLGNGKVPVTQVKEDQVEYFLSQERSKRREILQTFINECIAHRVKVETMLIEADEVADAIVELISVLQIQKLVIGVQRSKLRKLRARKGNGTAEKILQRGPLWCDIKFICEGKDVLHDDYMAAPSPRQSSLNDDTFVASSTLFEDDYHSQPKEKDFKVYCCFK